MIGIRLQSATGRGLAGIVQRRGAGALATRGFNTDAKKDAPVIPKHVTAKEMAKYMSKMNAFTGSPEYLPCVANPPPLPQGASDAAEKYTAQWPEEVVKDMSVRIYKPARNAMENTEIDTFSWALGTPNRGHWTNQIMNYASGSDPVANTGLEYLRFDELEEAISFCERNGLDYHIDESPYVDKMEGKKMYAANFLSFYARNQREKCTPKKLAKTLFAHKERGKTCWVNLKHSDYGEKPSETVSQTHWKDSDHPANHEAKDWYRYDLSTRQVYSRKFGK